MKREFKRQIVDLLNEHRIMTIATNRADGWPQATVVGYGNDGLVIYCLIARDSQKYANIMRDPRVSLAIAKDYPQPLQIKGLSIAATVAEVTDAGEIDHVAEILLQRYPEHKVMPRPDPARGADAAADAGDRVGHRLFQGLRPQRPGARHRQRPRRIHRGAPAPLGGISRRQHKRRVIEPVAPALTGVPRRNSSAVIGCLPARCTCVSRTAPSPQAMVRLSSSTVPGVPASLAFGRAQRLDAHAADLEPGAGKRRQAADVVVHLAATAWSNRCGSRPCRSSPRR